MTATIIRVEGNPFDLTTESPPVVDLARLLCSQSDDGFRPCFRCRGLAHRLLLIGDVRIEPRSEQHHGSLVSGIVDCSCGWSSNHHALDSDAIEQWEQHLTEREEASRVQTP